MIWYGMVWYGWYGTVHVEYVMYVCMCMSNASVHGTFATLSK